MSEDRLEVACQAARETGELQRARFGQERVIETKSSAIDLVTDVDEASEALLVSRIEQAFPDDGILSEESGATRESRNGWLWVIDPLDGTTNYAHGVPHYAVSIGVELEGRRRYGAIYDASLDELFAAAGGRGATRNGAPIQVSSVTELERALLATGFSYDVHASRSGNLVHFENFMKRAQAIRRPGSAALDLAYVACGRFDGFWELHLHSWDVSAGLLIVEEAGGRTSDVDGGAAPSSGARCLASNGHLHDEMLAVLAAGR